MAQLNEDYAEKKAAIERTKISAEYDAEIIKSTFTGSTMLMCQQVTTNDLKGESLHFWIRQLGRKTVHLTLCEIMSCYSIYFRSTKFVTDGEIVAIANFFLDKHPYSFRFSELIYFMNQAVTGRWGKIFGDLTAAIFFEWWVKYCEELAKQREDEHTTRKDITRPVVAKIEDLFKSKFKKWNPDREKPKEAADENWFKQNPLS